MYKYLKIPFTPSVASPLIRKRLLESNDPMQRKDLIDYALSEHLKNGGKPPKGDLTSVGKKSLQTLQSEKLIESAGYGFYRAARQEDTLEKVIDEEQREIDTNEEMQPYMRLEPEIILGEGAEILYLYFIESERKVAGFERKTVWPCKIGCTEGSLERRILEQGVRTSMVNFPTVGLVIKSDSSSRLEKAIHFALDEAGARIEDALGTEWFLTSPQLVRGWYYKFQESVNVLRPHRDEKEAVEQGAE